jgi:putative tryptophan/tyrosine transport system substrate-binding protein
MRRRKFILTASGAAVASGLAWLRTVRAQQKPTTLGILGTGTSVSQGKMYEALVVRLRELGWAIGRSVTIEYRWAEGQSERMAEIAAEFVRLKVDVIVTTGAEGIAAAQKATSTIPIVFAVTADPVAAGLVTSLAQPGGNVTGLSAQSADVASKRVGLLREVIPALRRLAIMCNTKSRGAELEMHETEAAARTLGLHAESIRLQRPEDVAAAFDGLSSRADALVVVPDPLVSINKIRILTLALGSRVPAIYGSRDYVEVGGFMSYGPNLLDLYRRAGEYVDKILRGAKPAGIPVEQPTKFELAINLTTAKVLGLSLPDKLLALADEVIE